MAPAAAPRARAPELEQRCRVVVASAGARAERAAVERVFRQCRVEAVRAPSGVNEQPSGHAETIRGAANRLDAAKTLCPGADYYVAIESGLLDVPIPSVGEGVAVPRHFDTSWVLMERGTAGGLRAAASSAGVELPARDVAAAKDRGLPGRRAAAEVAERAGLLDGRDPHAWLTAGRRDREALLGEAIAVALGQLDLLR
ncbi:unnamed protein product [Prorocentrum cordatum]|uniref:inosine/xanthosine triphosphatase n=1 Tax=Prorocentrum cordatum TaxID=2364126 RepID=A0ABN9TTC2_9DINO|nr:unnamed protein product [Polarella glacialis]